MDVMLAMQVFRRVVELRGFSAAARDLRLSNAAVSKQVAALEQRLHTKLLHRTTRNLSLTTAGAAYYERCTRILDDLAETERSLSGAAAEPFGVLRVNAPMSFSLQHLSPVLPEFAARYPDVQLDVGFTDRFVDLVEEGVDVAVRITSTLPDSATLLATKLARARHVVVAAPDYLKASGEPESPDDLAHHHCLVYSLSRSPGIWEFSSDGSPLRVTVKGRLTFNNSLAIRDAALAGAGIALLPTFYVHEDIRKRRLRVLLPSQEMPLVNVYGVYQRSRHLSPKVRVFVEFLRERLAKAPWSV